MRHRDWWMEFSRDLGSIALIVSLVAIVVAILLAHIRTQYDIAQAGYDIAQATRAHQKLAEQQKKLRVEAAVQGRSGRITSVARAQFGLEPVRPEQISILPPPPKPPRTAGPPAP